MFEETVRILMANPLFFVLGGVIGFAIGEVIKYAVHIYMVSPSCGEDCNQGRNCKKKCS